MTMVMVTKRFEFCYAHFLPNYDGPCATLHGHNAVLEITLIGVPRWVEEAIPEGFNKAIPKGMVFDFREFKHEMKFILDFLDHKCINGIDPAHANVSTNVLPHLLHMVENPTAENILLWILNSLLFESCIGKILYKIKLSETPDSWVEWCKDEY